MPVNPILLATTDYELPDSIVEKLNEDLIGQIGGVRFCCAGKERAITRSTEFEYYDRPDNLPESVTTVICHPSTPFYGPNYARGDWTVLAALIEVLRRRIPRSTVWYGPDSSGIVERVTSEWLDRMWDFWAINGHRPFRHFIQTKVDAT